MKTKIINIVIFCITLTTHASVWRVSKDATYLPHYSEVQAAVDGAEAGDSIYVYPGNYGDVVIRKKIALFGVGYFLVENLKDSLTYFTTPSNIGTVTFKPGSDNSMISGTSSGRIYCDSVNNLQITGASVDGITLNKSNSISINKNYFRNQLDGVNSQNLMINNNLGSYNVLFDDNSGGMFLHNYFNLMWASNFIIQNNISVSEPFNGYSTGPFNNGWWGGWHEYSQFSNCRVEKNVFKKVQWNIDNFSSSNALGSTDEIMVSNIKADKYLLNDTSIAKGAGVGGVDCGPFGGDDPYCLSGINILPTITSMIIPPKVSAGSGLKIKAIIKSNKP